MDTPASDPPLFRTIDPRAGDSGSRALAAARLVDEVKDIRDKVDRDGRLCQAGEGRAADRLRDPRSCCSELGASGLGRSTCRLQCSPARAGRRVPSPQENKNRDRKVYPAYDKSTRRELFARRGGPLGRASPPSARLGSSTPPSAGRTAASSAQRRPQRQIPKSSQDFRLSPRVPKAAPRSSTHVGESPGESTRRVLSGEGRAAKGPKDTRMRRKRMERCVAYSPSMRLAPLRPSLLAWNSRLRCRNRAGSHRAKSESAPKGFDLLPRAGSDPTRLTRVGDTFFRESLIHRRAHGHRNA